MDGSQSHSEAAPAINWFHSHAFPDGETTRGEKSIEVLRNEAEVVFRHGVAGKSVLDIGAWDGWFSFEAERRGAARVMATDHYCWSGEGWGTKAGFDYAHARYGSRVETQDMNVQQMSPQSVGVFDTVLMLGVLYHVKDPLFCLERAASVTGEVLVIETVTTFDGLPWKVMGYFEGDEYNADPTNHWAPNRRCLEAMLRDVGFRRTETVRNPNIRPHWRNPDLYWKHSRVVTHAWR